MQHHKVVIEDQRFRKIHDVWEVLETLYEHSLLYGEMACSSHCILLAILQYDWFDT
jgi:hypothetical protein